MALVLSLMGLCLCCTASAWYIPPPVTKQSKWPKFKLVADGRVTWDRTAIPIDVTSNDPRIPPTELARMQCEFDWTCKGFCVWKVAQGDGTFTRSDTPDYKWYMLKYKTRPDPFMTLPGYFTKKEDAKIYLRVE